MAATPSPNLADAFVLSGDATFIGRVQIALMAQVIAATGPGNASTPSLIRFAVSIANGVASYAPLFAKSMAYNTAVLADATVNGTVPLTGANVAAQAALVTDAHLVAALQASVPAFYIANT